MKVLKNKTVIGIIAVVLGILICFILSPLYNKSLEEKAKVVRVEKKIEKGQLITDNYVKVIEVGKYNLPKKVIAQKDKIVGKYAVTDMYPEDYVMPEKLSETPLSNNEYLENLDGVYGAVSVTVQTFAGGLSGKLLSGDIVSIIATDTKEITSNIPPELKYVKVLACTTKSGKDVDDTTINQEAEPEDKIAVTVTLLVTDWQAEILAGLESGGAIQFKLIYRGLEEDCNKFLEQQNKILEGLTQAASQNETNQKQEVPDTKSVKDTIDDKLTEDTSVQNITGKAEKDITVKDSTEKSSTEKEMGKDTSKKVTDTKDNTITGNKAGDQDE